MEEYKDVGKIIGKNLLTLRKNKKLTQLELADKFNYSDKSISKWETGDSLPSIEVLYELSRFYGVTLDALTSEEPIIPDAKPEKPVKDKMFPSKLIITLLAFTSVWLLATVIFVIVQMIFKISVPMVFMWAVPVSCIVLIVFNSIWGRSEFLFAILTVLVWSTLAAIHLQLLEYEVWIIYILGVPLQIVIILWGALLQKSSKRQIRKRNEKLKREQEALSADKNRDNTK